MHIDKLIPNPFSDTCIYLYGEKEKNDFDKFWLSLLLHAYIVANIHFFGGLPS